MSGNLVWTHQVIEEEADPVSIPPCPVPMLAAAHTPAPVQDGSAWAWFLSSVIGWGP
jgi:hypothetical protein